MINLPPKAIDLFITNASANAHNEIVLNALTTEGCKFMDICLVGYHVGNFTDKLRITVQSLRVSDTQCLAYELFLKISARYLMTIYNDTADGQVNGAPCLFQRMHYGTRRDTQERVPRISGWRLMIQQLEKKKEETLGLIIRKIAVLKEFRLLSNWKLDVLKRKSCYFL